MSGLRNPEQILPLRILGHPPRTKTQHARSPCRGTQYMTRGAVPLVTLKRGMPSLPFLSLRLAPNVGVNGPNPPPPTRVDERGGPWDSFTLGADSLPLLQSSLPLTIIYRKVNGAWLQHLLIAESALLRRAGAKPGFGVYALRPFRGPKSLQGSNWPLARSVLHPPYFK